MAEQRSAKNILAALRAARAPRATSPRAAAAPVNVSRAPSATRSRSTASRLESLMKQRNRAAEVEASPAASALKAARPLNEEVESLEHKVAALNQSYREKMAAAENFQSKRATSRNRRAQLSASLTGNSRFARPGVRTSTAKKANNAVEEINKEYAKLLREASKEQTALRDARLALEKKKLRMQSMPAAPARATSTTRKAVSASNINAQIAAAQQKLANIQSKKQAAVEKKTSQLSKRMDAAFKKLEVFNDDVLDAFCAELKERKRGAPASRAASPKAAAAENSVNLL